jgi:hypothetical protein
MLLRAAGRFAKPQKGVRLMSVFEALTITIAFAVLIVSLLNYIDKRK